MSCGTDDLDWLTALEMCILMACCSAGTLPMSWYALQNLTRLSLNFNNLSGIVCKTFEINLGLVRDVNEPACSCVGIA